MPYLSASAVVIYYDEALYQVYAPLPLPLPFIVVVVVIIIIIIIIIILTCDNSNVLHM